MKRPRHIADCTWPRPVLRLTEQEAATDAALRLYQRAVRIRRASDAELRTFGITFPLWRVLEATDRLIRETDEPVSQLDVCRRTGLDKGSVSYLMRRLSDRGLVERQPDAWDLAYRILLSERGERLLAASREAVVRVARTLLDE